MDEENGSGITNPRNLSSFTQETHEKYGLKLNFSEDAITIINHLCSEKGKHQSCLCRHIFDKHKIDFKILEQKGIKCLHMDVEAIYYPNKFFARQLKN